MGHDKKHIIPIAYSKINAELQTTLEKAGQTIGATILDYLTAAKITTTLVKNLPGGKSNIPAIKLNYNNVEESMIVHYHLINQK